MTDFTDELRRLGAAVRDNHVLSIPGEPSWPCEYERLVRSKEALAEFLHNNIPTILAMADENKRLREALITINRKASPDPERTMSEASNDLYWCACHARQALAGGDDAGTD